MKALEFIVKEIREELLNFQEVQASASEIGLEVEDAQVVCPVYSRLQFLRSNQNVYIKGDVSTSVLVECRRCAEPYETRIDATIELYFCHTEKPELDTDDTGERFYLGDIIDLSEDVRQALVLEIPVWALCSESCKGLCQGCGANLNVDECNCSGSEEHTSPFSVLASLLDPPNPAEINN